MGSGGPLQKQLIVRGGIMFTKDQRLILMLQFMILDRLEPKAGWKSLVTVLENGYTSEYSRITGMLFDELSQRDCEYVFDVLSMYDALQRPYADARTLDNLPDNLRFWGFDGNNEGKFMGFARYLMKDQ